MKMNGLLKGVVNLIKKNNGLNKEIIKQGHELKNVLDNIEDINIDVIVAADQGHLNGILNDSDATVHKAITSQGYTPELMLRDTDYEVRAVAKVAKHY